MISWLRGLVSFLHRDCFTLQMLTWSGSTKGSSFGLNVTVVLQVQPGHSQALGQTTFSRASSHHGTACQEQGWAVVTAPSMLGSGHCSIHTGLGSQRPSLALSLCLQQHCSACMSLSLENLRGLRSWSWAGRTQTRPGHRCWIFRASESLGDLAVLFTCTSTSLHLGSCHVLSSPGCALGTSCFAC